MGPKRFWRENFTHQFIGLVKFKKLVFSAPLIAISDLHLLKNKVGLNYL